VDNYRRQERAAELARHKRRHKNPDDGGKYVYADYLEGDNKNRRASFPEGGAIWWL
jgi:hypothetical protein